MDVALMQLLAPGKAHGTIEVRDGDVLVAKPVMENLRASCSSAFYPLLEYRSNLQEGCGWDRFGLSPWPRRWLH